MGARSWRAVNKQPQGREAQKPKQKKTLEEECKARITEIHEAIRERDERTRREKYREAEDEVMRMTYGPEWRTRDLPHDPKPSEVRVKILDDGDDDLEEERKAG